MGALVVLPMGCTKDDPKPAEQAETFTGDKLLRRYQLPSLKSYVTLPEDWKAQIKSRPNWKEIVQRAKPTDSAAQQLDSTLIFEARPSLKDWTPHLPRLEIYLDAPLAENMDLQGYFQKTGLGAPMDGTKILHAEKERLRLDDRSVLSTRRELEFQGPKPLKMRQYILHALVPVPELQDATVGLTFVLSATQLETLQGLKEQTLRAIMGSVAFKKRK
ncbi:MAG: hypothetical protein CMH56_09505 [Myxococcales bacterium]|nr:hypothetical protein [Myxococcales bacterium]